MALDARLRRAQLGARDARADRLRPPLPPQVRVVGAALRDGLSDVLGHHEVAPPRVLERAGKGGWPSFGQAVDLVIASIVSWTPLAADYTRFSRTRRGAGFGAGFGYFVPTVWCIGLGCLIVLARGVARCAVAARRRRRRGRNRVPRALAITIDESEKAFADIYSTAVSIQNLLPRVSQRLLITIVSAVADGARARPQPRQLPELPLPARLVLRAALRRPRRRLARRGRALQRGEHLQRAGPARPAARRMARRLLPLPVALAGRPGACG